MKIFSNFDTHLGPRLYREACEKYGKENAIFVRRDPIYVYLKVYTPVLIWLLIVLTVLLLFYGNISADSTLGSILEWTIWICVGLSMVYLSMVVVSKYIDYKMDYMIVTPRQVVSYDQEGILGRSTRALDISKIKSINVSKKGFLCSLFNYGSIVFFAEGDDKHGDIRMNYITHPVGMKDQISKIIDEHYKMQYHMNSDR